MKYLVTGAAGFIGFHVASHLLSHGYEVIGLDNINSYYDPQLKLDRLDMLSIFPKFKFTKGDLTDRVMVELCVLGVDKVIHLAAQAGVGYSDKNPHAYIDSNITGFLNILEACRKMSVSNVYYASSSSVYGEAPPPWTEDTLVRPVSFYGTTKLMNEQMAFAYSKNYGINSIGMRFFTVYGPWGRPDMAMMIFLDALTSGKDIYLYGHGRTARDFTYIDDCARHILKLVNLPNICGTAVVNIGSDTPHEISHVLNLLEKYTGETARSIPVEKPSWDIQKTHASVRKLFTLTGSYPSTPLECGLQETVKWYLNYRRKRKSGEPECAKSATLT